MPRPSLALIFLFTSLLCAAYIPMNIVEKIDLSKYFLKHKIEPQNGTFVLYDYQKQTYKIFNITKAKEKFSPSSTFQIMLSLIALETKLVKDENELVKWNGTVSGIKEWDKNQNLSQALRNSTTWFYQHLAEKMDPKSVEQLLLRSQYSNADLRDNLQTCWISGQTRVSALEQIEMLKKLYEDKLPFSKNNQEIVKRFMFIEQYDGDKLLYGKIGSTKTASTIENPQQVVWFIGYVKKGPNVYLFVSNIASPLPPSGDWVSGDAYKARIQIVKDIFSDIL